MPYSEIRERVCQNCGTSYTLGVDSTLHKYCKVKCRNAHHNKHSGKIYRNSDKGKASMRRWRLFKEFNLTEQDYDSMFAKQNYSCAICKTKEPTGYNWHVDHCHTTNKVRGILCSKCNQGLGLFNDDGNILMSAKEYLESF